MMMISGDWKQYSGLFSREVGYQYAIRTVVQEMRGLMNVGAETWEIGYEYEWSRDDSVRAGAEKNAGVCESYKWRSSLTPRPSSLGVRGDVG